MVPPRHVCFSSTARTITNRTTASQGACRAYKSDSAARTIMKPTCILATDSHQSLLRSLKRVLEPEYEVTAMTDNVVSMIDAIRLKEDMDHG